MPTRHPRGVMLKSWARARDKVKRRAMYYIGRRNACVSARRKFEYAHSVASHMYTYTLQKHAAKGLLWDVVMRLKCTVTIFNGDMCDNDAQARHHIPPSSLIT